MERIESAQKIVAQFLRQEPGAIRDETVIDRRALAGSVLVHRMFASLQKAGIHVADRSDIHTFGDLKRYLSGIPPAVVQDSDGKDEPPRQGQDGVALGVDIEVVTNLPSADDFRDEPFYTQNFSPREIAHCLMQAEPIVSFAGKFAAKEAIIKADNSLQKTPFNHLEILNDARGKPYYRDFVLSISHTPQYAVAVAVKGTAGQGRPSVMMRPTRAPLWLVAVTLGLSLVALLVFLFALA